MNFFTPRVNVTFECFKFFKTNQHAGESIDSILTNVRFQARKCTFEQLEESLICDQIILEIDNDELSSKLLMEDKTLTKVLQACRAIEITACQMREINNGVKNMQVSVLRKRCGTKHAARSCPAFGKKCSNCQIIFKKCAVQTKIKLKK